jgi:hypothetical protein
MFEVEGIEASTLVLAAVASMKCLKAAAVGHGWGRIRDRSRVRGI